MDSKFALMRDTLRSSIARTAMPNVVTGTASPVSALITGRSSGENQWSAATMPVETTAWSATKPRQPCVCLASGSRPSVIERKSQASETGSQQMSERSSQ